jgi:hypothetical protein
MIENVVMYLFKFYNILRTREMPHEMLVKGLIKDMMNYDPVRIKFEIEMIGKRFFCS